MEHSTLPVLKMGQDQAMMKVSKSINLQWTIKINQSHLDLVFTDYRFSALHQYTSG